VPFWRRRGVVRLGALGFGALVAIGGAFGTFQQASDAAPDVGECAQAFESSSDESIRKVSCNDARAVYVVTSRADGIENGDKACAADMRATSYYVESVSSGDISVGSFVLCLAER